jgi:hypothetical protein
MNLHFDSALFWFPRIQKAGLPVPKTVFIPYDYKAILPIFDGLESNEYNRLWHAVVAATGEIGLPAFLRSDVTSAKHKGPAAYKITDIDGLNEQLCRTLEETELKTFMHYEKPKALMVRQWLDLYSTFTAFHGLPISREFRLFANQSEVVCGHPYWPESAIAGYTDDPDWKNKLKELESISSIAQQEYICSIAVKAAKSMGSGTWSVDFAQDVNSQWWLTDMALAESSYHDPSCKNIFKEDLTD